MVAGLNRVSNHEVESNTYKDASRSHVSYYIVCEEQDQFSDSSLLDPTDSAQHGETVTTVDKLIIKVAVNGFPSEHVPHLKPLVLDHMDPFKTPFSSGPPAHIAPLKLDIDSNAPRASVCFCNYSQKQRKLLSQTVSKPVECRAEYSMSMSPWALTPLLLPKQGEAKFCFTVAPRPDSQFIVRHQFPMPNIEQEFVKVAGSPMSATFDSSHSYWHLPLHGSSQALQSFITPVGVYTPSRVLHEMINAVMSLQSTMSSAFTPELRRRILLWLEDVLIHAPIIDRLLMAI